MKKFQPILASAEDRDVNESDTVVIITDMLHEIFGYDKYSEITSEYVIRGTYCDLAVKLDGQIILLVEVKAIGLEIKDKFVKQAVDYAHNQGCEWVAITTGLRWRVYRVLFTRPIDKELIVDFDIGALNPRNKEDLERLWLLTKEGRQKGRLRDYAAQRRALSRFSVAGVLLTAPVLNVVRRELRRITPDVRLDTEKIEKVLREEVLKREVLEGEKADAADKLVTKASKRTLRKVNAGGEEVKGKGN